MSRKMWWERIPVSSSHEGGIGAWTGKSLPRGTCLPSVSIQAKIWSEWVIGDFKTTPTSGSKSGDSKSFPCRPVILISSMPPRFFIGFRSPSVMRNAPMCGRTAVLHVRAGSGPLPAVSRPLTTFRYLTSPGYCGRSRTQRNISDFYRPAIGLSKSRRPPMTDGSNARIFAYCTWHKNPIKHRQGPAERSAGP